MADAEAVTRRKTRRKYRVPPTLAVLHKEPRIERADSRAFIAGGTFDGRVQQRQQMRTTRGNCAHGLTY